jgi:hypothetical protein
MSLNLPGLRALCHCQSDQLPEQTRRFSQDASLLDAIGELKGVERTTSSVVLSTKFDR